LANSAGACRWAALLCLVPLTAQAGPTPRATPEKVKAALPRLEKLIEQTLKKTGVPGLAVAVVHQDRVVYLKGFGVRQAGKSDAVDADTVFQLASVSKPVASTVLAALVCKKVIAWDDRVIDHDPGFRLADPWVTRNVTLRDLLCHRGGLPDHAGDLLEDLGYDRTDVLRRLRFQKLRGFRSRYAYTNFGYTAAAVAAARAAGKSWEDLSADKLYRPVGMKSTSSRFRDFSAAKNRALLHAQVKDRWVAKYVRDPDAQSPAGGVSSTARDMARWMRLHLAGGKFQGKQLIATEALAETHRPQVISHAPENPATEPASFYGLGWNVNYDDRGRPRLGHSGGFALGAATTVTLCPSEGLGIVVLTNTAPVGVPEALSASFFDLVFTGKIEKDWVRIYKERFKAFFQPGYDAKDYSRPPPRKSPPLPWKAYAGTYRNAYFGDSEVSEQKGGLLLRLGPKKTSFALRHWDRDVFLYQPEGENAGGLSAVTFTVGPDRIALRVVIQNLDIHGQGTFTRRPARK
jgi:CubicO group peptidase (beta-lactamase class C family)